MARRICSLELANFEDFEAESSLMSLMSTPNTTRANPPFGTARSASVKVEQYLASTKSGPRDPIPPVTDDVIVEERKDNPPKVYPLAAGQSRDAIAALVNLLSVMYALVLVSMSFTFETSVLLAKSVTSTTKYEGFYIYLYVVGVLFLVYAQGFLLYSQTKKFTFFGKKGLNEKQDVPPSYLVSHSAPSAGSLFLRLGCVCFGLAGLIFYGLEIVGCATSSYTRCSWTFVTSTSFAVLFVFAQMYFVFQNSKMVIHRFKHIGRFGLMHLVATNLSIWIRLLVLEEFAIIGEIQAEQQMIQIEDFPPISRSEVLKYFGLKRTPEAASSLQLNCTISKSIDCLIHRLRPYMTTCIIEYSMICAAITFVLWKNVGLKPPCGVQESKRQSFRVDCSSSTKGLFLGLIFVVSAVVAMIVFFVKVTLQEDIEFLWIFYITDSILYFFALLACIFGFRCMKQLSYVPSQKETMLLLDDILLFGALVGQVLFCIFSTVALREFTLMTGMIILVSLFRVVQVLFQTVFILATQRLRALTSMLQRDKPGRETVTFLLMVNLVLFLVDIFETQKATVNPVMLDFYGKTKWMIIVHSCVPLVIFFRFHSSVCLAEIWKQAYKVKNR